MLDTQVRDVLLKIQKHIDVLEQVTSRLSGRAEVFGAVQQVSIDVQQVSIDVQQVSIDVQQVSIDVQQVSIDVQQVSIDVQQVSIDVQQVSIDVQQVTSRLSGRAEVFGAVQQVSDAYWRKYIRKWIIVYKEATNVMNEKL